jgi:predicted nucleic acid-binding protein
VILSDTVLDSSIFIASAFTEQHTEQAVALFASLEREQSSIHAPHLLHYEVVSVIRKLVSSGRLPPVQGLAIRNEVLQIPVRLHFDRELVERAYDFAQDLKLPRAYDAQYLALAERLGCVRTAVPLLRWLGNFEV